MHCSLQFADANSASPGDHPGARPARFRQTVSNSTFDTARRALRWRSCRPLSQVHSTCILELDHPPAARLRLSGRSKAIHALKHPNHAARSRKTAAVPEELHDGSLRVSG